MNERRLFPSTWWLDGTRGLDDTQGQTDADVGMDADYAAAWRVLCRRYGVDVSAEDPAPERAFRRALRTRPIWSLRGDASGGRHDAQDAQDAPPVLLDDLMLVDNRLYALVRFQDGEQTLVPFDWLTSEVPTVLPVAAFRPPTTLGRSPLVDMPEALSTNSAAGTEKPPVA